METELNTLIAEGKLKWLPWVGENYETSSKKILIIGESHYYNPKEPGSFEKNEQNNFTREIVKELAIRKKYYKTNFFQNFHYAVIGNDDFDSNKFWSSLSFYNFVQRSMKTNGKRPENKDFKKGWESFIEIIKILKPDTCIFVGSSCSITFNSSLKKHKIDFTTVKNIKKIDRAFAKSSSININSKTTNIHFIRHTSKYFSWRKWNEYLKNNLSEELDSLNKIISE